MAKWNLGDILDAIEPALPADTPALIHGTRVVTWAEMGARSNNIARFLTANGILPGTKVAFYMRNRPEYGELMAACFKGRFTHVNINYRYRPEEVFYIFDDSDSEAIFYSADFRATERLAALLSWRGDVADALATAPPDVPVDDALDALAALWSAVRWRDGQARTVPADATQRPFIAV